MSTDEKWINWGSVAAFVLLLLLVAVVAERTLKIPEETPAPKPVPSRVRDGRPGDSPRESPTPASDRLVLRADQEEILRELEKSRLLRLEPASHEAYVASTIWLRLDVKQKADYAATLAIACGNRSGSYSYWVDVYDYHSGKKVASFSQAWGFKVY